MKVEIDDKRLKQLYNLESYCKKIFGDNKYVPDIQRVMHSSEVDTIRNILKPIPNRPTLEELDKIFCDAIDIYDPIPQHHAGLKAVITEVYEGMRKEYRQDEDISWGDVVYKHYREYKDD